MQTDDYLKWVDLEYDDPHYRNKANELLESEIALSEKHAKISDQRYNFRFIEGGLLEFCEKAFKQQHCELDAVNKTRFKLASSGLKLDGTPLDAIRNANVQLEYQGLRAANLAILEEKATKAYNYCLYEAKARLQEIEQALERLGADVKSIDKERKTEQVRLKMHIDNLSQKYNEILARLYHVIYAMSYLKAKQQTAL